MKIHVVMMIAVTALAACKRAPQEAADLAPVKEVVAGTPMIDFKSTEAHFSCRAPRDWGLREKHIDSSKGAVFVGPAGPAGLGLSYISILKYPESEPQYTDARKYAETFWEIDPRNKQPDITRQDIGGKSVLRFHQERPFYKPHSRKLEYVIRYDYALIPVQNGFYSIEHRAPVADHAATLPVFEAVVASFQPGS